MKATLQDHARLEQEVAYIDLLVLFDEDRPSRELTREVYKRVDARESVDILAYSLRAMDQLRDRPFFRHILS